MCGRTACSLNPDAICKGCTFKDSNGKLQKPVWKNAENGKSFVPSYNISPGQYTPVMISSQHYKEASDGELGSKRVIQPMRWGLIPSWHKGNLNNISYQTNNCRSETMLEKKMFKVPLEKGRRCVVLVEGYYEWKKCGQTKQAYFICPQLESGGAAVKEEKEEEEKKKKEGKKEEEDEEDDNIPQTTDEKPSKPLMKMAGVFDICQSNDGKDDNLYSYSVLTVAASPLTADIHHRMPAILSTEQEVEQWLDFGSVPISDAVKIIRPQECIELYPVSTAVNNSRHNSPECIKPLDMKIAKTALDNWLKKGLKKEADPKTDPKDECEEEEEEGPPAKKIKQEE
ncbi:abasic site processing protein HMCES-like [Argonauta hians]